MLSTCNVLQDVEYFEFGHRLIFVINHCLGLGNFILRAAKNIHIDNKARIIPEDNEVIKGRICPLTNISTGDNHLIA